MRIENNMTLFWDGVFSNFHPCNIEFDGHIFNCSEQLFMYFKAKYFKDDESVSLILEAKDPMTAKKLGRKVKGYDDSTWSNVRYQFMLAACMAKFHQNEDLKQELLNTSGTDMVEASPLDPIWGIGLHEDDPLAWDKKSWKGTNLLGRALDLVRDKLANI